MTSPEIEPAPFLGVVFDLDGVVRHYDRRHEADIERRFGMPPGSLLHLAFGGELGRAFMQGAFDHQEFARRLAPLLGSTEAADEFVSMRAEVDPAAVALVRAVQALVPTALLTNGSVRTRQELDDAGLHDAFHHVVNSAETGIPKPAPGAFHAVLEVLGTPVGRTAFIDDHLPNVDGAAAVGMVAHHYSDLNELREFLATGGLRV